jgi:hypothetical protein
MPSLRDGCDLRDPNVWTISLFSAKPICVEFYPRTSPNTIAADRTARWAKQFHAARQGPSLGKHAERSPPNLCLAGYTTFTAPLHDKFLRPTGGQGRSGVRALRAFGSFARRDQCLRRETARLRQAPARGPLPRRRFRDDALKGSWRTRDFDGRPYFGAENLDHVLDRAAWRREGPNDDRVDTRAAQRQSMGDYLVD